MDSTITKEQLLENGWTHTIDAVFPFQKILAKDDGEGGLSLVLHRMMNVNMFAVLLPDGSLLNINPVSIDELNSFEKLILGYMPNY